MSRLEARFEALARQRRAALIPYLTAGDPSLEALVPVLHGLVAGGADVIEIGIPFSDPMADGPVIQAACDRAIARGTTIDVVLAAVGRFRVSDAATPLVLMGYLNPIAQYGEQRFARSAAAAGVDGVLVVDASLDLDDPLGQALRDARLSQIRLIAPTTSAARIGQIADRAAGFLYYVSLRGVTGAAHLAVDEAESKVAAIRAHTSLPVAVGFGVRDAGTAAAVAAFADAVVVGSALVERLAAAADSTDAVRLAQSFMAELRHGMVGPVAA